MRISGLLFIVLLIAIGYFVLAPWFAFRSMRDAARTDDVPALAHMIDYDAVRQSLAPQVQGGPPPVEEAPAPSLWRDPVGAIKHAFKTVPPPPPQVETYITSKALAALADGRPANAALPAKEPFPMIAFWGPDRCRITVADPATPSRHTEFTFQRHGLTTWKLTRIVLPGKAAVAA